MQPLRSGEMEEGIKLLHFKQRLSKNFRRAMHSWRLNVGKQLMLLSKRMNLRGSLQVEDFES